MYTEVKSYQIIIQLLKEYGIRHCVLSAGSRNVPFVHSVEEDPFFKCYSVVDERSAGYFALGLAQELNEPVVISCTSATATCNYWPPISEAYYQGVPIVVLTGDRDPEMLGQHEDQMIDQAGMYDRHVRKSVNLPIIKDDDDYYYCMRLVNEALLELNHRGRGPVHINVPIKYFSMGFPYAELPSVTKINRIDWESPDATWGEYRRKLLSSSKILVVCGQQSSVSGSLEHAIERFANTFNCAIALELMSNLHCSHSFNPFIGMDDHYISEKKAQELLPDIVISFGGNFMSGIKSMLRRNHGAFEHWIIDKNGEVCDPFKSLSLIFECSPETFFNKMCDGVEDDPNDGVYESQIEEYLDSIVYPDFPWSNIYAIEKATNLLQDNAILHMSINSSIRLSNFFKVPSSVTCYANIGTHGIDGCMSSFLGQSVASPQRMSYLFIGDLSFFYDMNSLRIRHYGSNVRILLFNNHGGEEFYYNGVWKNEASDLHTTARHNDRAESWAVASGFTYLTASDKESFNSQIELFMRGISEKPMLFEVFTEMSEDAKATMDFYELSRPRDIVSEAKRKSKELVKATVGKEAAVRIAGKFGINLK